MHIYIPIENQEIPQSGISFYESEREERARKLSQSLKNRKPQLRHKLKKVYRGIK